MIWQICFISLNHLFEIQLFSSHINYPLSQHRTYISWTDDTHNRLFIEPNTSGIYVDRCNTKLKYLLATCLSTNRNLDQTYTCRSTQAYNLQKRLKRSPPNKSKRTLYVFLLFTIGILCFVIGIMVGIVTTIYISMKRQQQREHQNQQSKANKRPDPMIKSLSTNNEIFQRLKQNKISTKSPPYFSTPRYPMIRREGEIIDKTPISLNQYKTLQEQSPKRERLIQAPVSNPVYTGSPVTVGNNNLSMSKIPLKQQHKISKNMSNNTDVNSLHDLSSKSC